MMDWLYSRAARWALRGLTKGADVSRVTLSEGGAGWDIQYGQRMTAKASDLWGELTLEEQAQAYRAHAVVYRCIRLITTSYHQAALEMGSWGVDDDQWEVARNPMAELLARPNPDMGARIFWEYTISRLLLTGSSYVWKWRDGTGAPSELWPVPSHWVKPLSPKRIVRGQRAIKAFEIRFPNGAKLTAAPEDMIWLRSIDPSDMVSVVSPLQASYRDYRLDLERQDYMIEMFENMRVPSLILKYNQLLIPEQRAEIREKLRESIGSGRRGSPLLLDSDGGVDVETLAPLKDLDWPGLSAQSESRICMAFGVPPLLVHARVAQENTPLSAPNLEAAERVFFRDTMTGLWLTIASSLTQGLVHDEPTVDEGLEFRFDTSEVAALQADLEKTSRVVEIAIRSGIMQVNEARAMLRLPPDDTQDGTYLRPINLIEERPGEPDEEESPIVPVEEHLQDWEGVE